MVLEDGSPNLAFFKPPKSYRSPEGFQKARWGMSEAQVRKLFPKASVVKGRGLYFQGETAGLKTNTFFLFTGDRLAVVSVQSREIHMSATKYLEDHKRLKDLLLLKYGAPLKDEEDWKETLLQNQPDGLQAALVLGHAELRTTWKTGESGINLVAEGKEGRVQVSVQYASLRLAMQMMNKAAKAEADDL
jgi:hypothetical protein